LINPSAAQTRPMNQAQHIPLKETVDRYRLDASGASNRDLEQGAETALASDIRACIRRRSIGVRVGLVDQPLGCADAPNNQVEQITPQKQWTGTATSSLIRSRNRDLEQAAESALASDIGARMRHRSIGGRLSLVDQPPRVHRRPRDQHEPRYPQKS